MAHITFGSLQRVALGALIATFFAGQVWAQQEPAPRELSSQEVDFFESRIRPVLIKDCYGCHSAKSGASKGGLMVDTKDGMLIGGDSGAAIVPGDLDESLLWSAINHEDYNMPPGKMLSQREIADFKQWIEMGAPDPRVVKAANIKSEITPEDIEKGKEFWAFKMPTMPSLPDVAAGSWSDEPIDQFVLAKLEENELKPAVDANAESVLRRLSFDLVGLPPNPQQTAAFKSEYKKDPRAAIEKVVDDLLARKEFGERWGRHWLDLARYAESTGKEVNITFPNAWRYRDYVIDSFNKDKPYDRFVQEQIAGDLLPASSDAQWAESLTATGFLAMGPKTLTEQNGRQFHLDLIDEQVDISSRVVLGVSVACARCHDHKFDPIPQTDYYAMSGIFENTTTHYGTIDTVQNRRPSNLLVLPVADPKLASKKISRKELGQLKEALEKTQEQLVEAQRERRQKRRGMNSQNTKKQDSVGVGRSVLNVARASSKAGALEAKLNSYDSNGMPYTFVMGVQEADAMQETRLLVGGEFNQPGQVVDRGLPQVLCEQPVEIEKRSSGRLELARWMGSDANPLTARVMVNRIWQHMMGHGLVRTPENFGSTGQRPTHPQLLDYLAVKFVEDGWSMKSLIREIAISRTYRTSSQFDQKSFEVDPENELLWRFEPRRLEAEAIRDSILMISGDLQSERPYASIVGRSGDGLVREGSILSVASPGEQKSMGGRGMRRRRGDGGGVKPSVATIDQPSGHRSVYLPVVRDNVARSLDVFDFADANMVVGKRESSNTPDQGLYFLNSKFVIDQSQKFAKKLMQEASEPQQQIRLGILWAYGREATAGEISAAIDFYQEFVVSGQGSRRDSSDEALEKLSALCQGILAGAEFRYLN